MLDKKIQSLGLDDARPEGPRHFRRPTSPLVGATQRMLEAPTQVKLSDIDESPFQVREITPEQVQELADNLAVNPLASPVVLRSRPSGRYELIAGHRRTRAFALLGRATIPAVVVALDDAQAQRALVFDNLITPDLPDYEKYLTLKSIKESEGWSNAELAAEAGISKVMLTYLLSFKDLPVEAHAVLAVNRGLLGCSAAYSLSKASRDQPGLVVQIVEQIAAGKVKQSQIAALLAEKTRPKQDAEKVEPVEIKSGKKVFARLVTRGDTVSVKLADKKLAAKIAAEVESILRRESASH